MKAVISRVIFFFLSIYVSVIVKAQDNGGKKIDVDIDVNKHDNWYQQPWVWVVGAAVFIILIVALTRGNNRRA